MSAGEYTTLFMLAGLTFLSLTVIIIIYGFWTPWWRSRTGIGFMSTKLTLWLMLGLTLMNGFGIRLPFWAAVAAWTLEIVALNWGITWNLIVKQFIEKRSDVMEDKTVHIERTNNV